MARLRVKSHCKDGEEYAIESTDLHENNEECNSYKKSTIRRTSPRKPATNVYSYDQLEHSLQKSPRKLASAIKRSKQIRLIPLNALETAQPLQLISDEERKKERKLPLEERFQSQTSLQNNKEPGSLAQTLRTHNLETSAEIKESLFDDSLSSSDESLPSPSRFMKATTREPNPCHGDQAKIDESCEKYVMARLEEFRIESDNEDNNPAILRFSPPRLYSPEKHISSRIPSANSPCVGKLKSPSKRANRSADQPSSPLPDTPQELSRPRIKSMPEASPANQKTARHKGQPPLTQPRSPTKPTKKAWEARKRQLAETFLEELDTVVAKGQIQALSASTGGVRLVWSKTLNSTAGRAHWKRETTRTLRADGVKEIVHKHHASIDIAEKIIDSEVRLLNVIAHEFCHLCNYMISGIKDQPHGAQFKEWGRKCSTAFANRGIVVTTKHSYEIDYKYVWQCSNDACAVQFKRHSKSIDPTRQMCGSCKSKLRQIKPVPRACQGGVGYATYVKEHFAEIKAALPAGTAQKDVMKEVARRYRADKAGAGAKDEEVISDMGKGMDGIVKVMEVIDLEDHDGPPLS
ncbi:hypothetical protein K470DRAFT_254504 [Piedraia hortae CBS 480.64]|uniref:SprT-like domain-containing protein n=1 Tax=Piedraia hortae CBS 480.64 TaxID=1314780 RepID=A0A6A7C9R5_9PEZI|nr:hypothetical protein K470DRAFT_254504 [Piedraia hortae CBS 480.64]